MRVARFSHNDEVKFGIVDGTDLVVLKGHPLVNQYETTGDRIALDQVKLLAPTLPSKVVCIGKNYLDHIAEMGMAVSNEEPTIFLKPSSSIIGEGENIVLPRQSQKVDLESELAIVIGRVAKDVPEAQALNYVWGFTIANDVTARDLQYSDVQWARGKSFDTFCPMGPWIETDFVPAKQAIQAAINDEIKQDSTIDHMIHNVPRIISFVSENMTLLPGDVILTGTPAGITQLQPGDVVDCTVEGIGTLSNPVVAQKH